MDLVGYLLILISSLTLGIWATVDTIALRNILLTGGAIVAIYYLLKWPLKSNLCHSKASLFKSNILYFLPILLVALTLLWVVFHYIFFAQFPEKQFQELTSTWYRALLSAMLGSATAIAFIRNPKSDWLLWLGLMISFLVLLIQYIPKAIANGSFMAYDPFGNYIYYAKFNGVLAGVILLAGSLAFLIEKNLDKSEKKTNTGNYIFYIWILFGIILPFYAFVNIFNAKNGVGISIILFFFWIIYGAIYIFINSRSESKLKILFKNKKIYLLLTTLIIVLFLSFQHSKLSPGWNTLIEDFAISVQVEKYKNWRDPGKYGYPKKQNGETVAPNTFERIAWATVGLKLIAEDPVGIGIFRALRIQMEQRGIEFNGGVYTHSGWVDLGLAYGLPGLILLPMCFLICLIGAIAQLKKPGATVIISLSVVMLMAYLVGEYAFQHGIEILIYMSSFLSFLFLQLSSNLNANLALTVKSN